jgi:hypothetical protein
MVPVIYAPEAEHDLDAITAYTAKDNPNAAKQFGYRIGLGDQCVEILRFWHSSRDPGSLSFE